MADIRPVILCGGAGTRLWPASRSMYPKQLLPLTGEHSMLQDTLLRIADQENTVDDCIVVCNEAHRFLVAEQLLEIDVTARIVLEPEGRNTAPAVALAASLVAEIDADSLMLVMPADHVIEDVEAFHAAVARGVEAASEGQLVTFGIVPNRPETGYGYIQAVPDTDKVVKVESFVEKPDLDTAREYLSGGRHFWNSGMFLFGAGVYLDALAEHAPEIHAACRQSMQHRVDGKDFVRPDGDSFRASPADSLDYAIMEKTDKAAMVPLDAGWSDVGSWAALHDVRNSDEAGNTIDGDVLVQDL